MSAVEKSTDQEPELDHRAAAVARFTRRVVERGHMPEVVLDMLKAAERWERERPEQDQFTDPDEWWSAFERWERTRGDEAWRLIVRFGGYVGYFEDGGLP